MDYNVRISNSNIVMGNIREMTQTNTQKDYEKEIWLDFLFEPQKNTNYDSFKKI